MLKNVQNKLLDEKKLQKNKGNEREKKGN